MGSETTKRADIYKVDVSWSQIISLLPACLSFSQEWIAAQSASNSLEPALANLRSLLFADSVAVFSVPVSRAPTQCLGWSVYGNDAANPPKSKLTRNLVSFLKRDARLYMHSDLERWAVGNGSMPAAAKGCECAEVAIILLDRNEKETVFAEVCFASRPEREDTIVLSAFSDFMAETWADPRLNATANLSNSCPSASVGNVLGQENSYGLSPSEQKICSLIHDGAAPKNVASELGLSIATVRTHLRSIYAKTETSGQVELRCLMCGLPPKKAVQC